MGWPPFSEAALRTERERERGERKKWGIERERRGRERERGEEEVAFRPSRQDGERQPVSRR